MPAVPPGPAGRPPDDPPLGQSWVCSDGCRAYDRLHPAGPRRKRVDHGTTLGTGRTHVNGIENCWRFAKRKLKMYHGGWERNSRPFVRERGFRLNRRRDPKVVGTLVSLLTFGPP